MERFKHIQCCYFCVRNVDSDVGYSVVCDLIQLEVCYMQNVYIHCYIIVEDTN
jgi:hypothetical protein